MNNEDFIFRLEKIFDYYGLTASGFADKIGIQRSSISHLLSGRNKPSLDFILKVIDNFEDVDLLWILNGKGNFPKNDISEQLVLSEKQKAETTINQTSIFDEQKVIEKTTVFENSENNVSNIPKTNIFITDDSIERIVVFYKNGSFKNYLPE